MSGTSHCADPSSESEVQTVALNPVQAGVVVSLGRRAEPTMGVLSDRQGLGTFPPPLVPLA